MRRKERAKRFLALLLAFTMIFTSSSMNVLAATIVGGYKNSNKQTEAGDDTQAETQASETQAAETNEDGSEVRQNTVTFATDGHAHIVINGATVDSTANAKDGKIVFDVVVENGYAVESVLVDKSIPARTQGDGSYIIEGIQTNETTVDVTTAAVETEAQETTVESESEIETETETESESETEIETETNLEKPAQKLTVTAADGARIIVNAPEGALPEGSSVRAEVIESKAIETVLENTVESSGKELSSYKAYDITIIGPDGMAIQPDDRVKVSIRNVNVDGEENAVYHVDGASADKIADIANGNHASFEAEHFSIYVITGENTPAIATYEFYADGERINSQSIKNGEMLIEPAAPEFEGKYFSGWFEEGSTTALSFHSPVTVTTTRTIRVTAKYNPALYVFFTNEAGVVIRTKNGTAGTDISTSDVIFPVSATQGITGWYTDKALTTKVDTVRLKDKDVILYPKVEEGYHITYMGEGGSYTAPVFVLPTDNTVAPKAPTRPGYRFKYWSRTQNGPVYQFGTKITSDITLHAVWEAKDTTYLVMYWQENANYNNEYLDESKRDKEQYSYATSETKKGKTGEQTKVSGWKGTVPAGFTLKTIEQKTIAGDGSTVVNVYLDRKTYIVTFMKKEYGGGFFPQPTWKEDESKRITAKYGADVSSRWPGEVWSVTKNGGPYQSNLMIMERDMIFYYAGNGNGEKADYYIQTLPGESGITFSGITYKLDHTDVAAGKGYIVTDEDRYAMNGFTINIKDSTKNGKPYKNAKFYYTRNKYPIAFINGGHTVETLEKYYEESLTGVTCSQTLTPPAGKESYQFAGWYDNPEGEGREYSFDGRMMPANGITVYAKWVAPTFNITVHHTLNASDAPTIITKKLGEKISEDDLQVTVPDGYSFRGWYLYENGQRTQAYNTNTEIHGNITLVPYWTSNAAFRVTYSAGEGTGEVTDTLSYAEDAQAELKSAGGLTAPAGKPHFQGWKSSVNNAIYYPGDTCVIKGDVTFTAQWGEEKKATLTYSPGNGDGTETSYTVDNNAEITAMSVEELGFSKADYTFIGWNYTNAEGKAAVAKAGDKLHVDVNATPGNLITAQWAKLNADGGIWSYDGKQHTVSNVSVDGIEGYSISYKVDGKEYNNAEDVSITNAETKKVTVIARKAGYAELTKEVTLQITPLEVTVTVVGKHDTREYNGTVQFVNGYRILTTNGLYHIGENVNGPTQAAAVASRKDVGTTYMELSSEKFTNINPNFKVTFDVTDGYIIITEKKISDESMKVTDPSDLPYNGKEQKWSPTVEDTVTNANLQETVDYTVSYDKSDFTNVTGKITVTITGTGNYTGTVTKTYQITPAPIKITTESGSKVYDGTPLTAPGRIDGLVDGEEVSFTVTGSQTNVGSSLNSYTLKWDKTAKESNYRKEADALGTLTVTAQSIVPDPDNPESYKGVVINDPVDVPYDGQEHKWSPTVTDKENNPLTVGTDYTVSYDKEDFTNVTGKITVTITGIGNYTGTVTKTYQIIPASIKITTESDSKVYDGTPLTAPGKIYGLVDGEEVSFTVTGSQTNVGSSPNSYTLKWDKTAKESNYTITEESIGTLTVSESEDEIIVTTTGGTFTYDGKEHTATVRVSELPKGYRLIKAESTAKAKDVTEEAGITATADQLVIQNASGKDVTSELKITYKNDTIKIVPATVKVITESAGKVYDGTPLTAPGKINGLVDGEEVSFTVTGSQTNVGSSPNTYTMVWDKNAKESNYRKEADDLGTLTVTAQSIVPDPDNPESYKGVVIDTPADVPYDGQEHKWSPTVTDKENNPLTVGTDYTVSYDKEDFTNVTGEITVTITGTGNYTGEVTRTYQITPKNVTVTTESDSKPYDGTPLTAGGKVEGIVEGETYGFTITGSQTLVGSSDNTYELTWAEEAVAITDHDESVPYTAKKSNYTVTYNIGILTVTDGTPEIPLNPDLVVRKEDDKDEGYQYKLGEVVTFKISVTNIYATEQTVQITELEGVKINDGTNIYEQTGVQPGQTIEVTATYTITEADIAAGFFKNIVKVKFSGGKEFENEKTVTTEEAKRSYTLIKMADESTHESGMFKVGETIHYTITVTNTGNQTLKNLQITDTLKAAGTISNIKADGVTYTQNGGTTIFTVEEVPAKAYNEEKATPVVIEYDYLVQEADKGNTISNAAVGKDSEDPEKPGEGDETNTQIENPKLTVTKTVEAITGSDGKEKDVNGKASLNDVITYKVTVKNTGNVTLKNAKISDSLEGIVLADNQKLEIGDLAVGEEKSVVYTYKVKEKDLGSSVVNKATATADVPEDPEETPKPKDDDEKEVPTDEKNAALRVTKTVTSKGSTITVDGKDVNGYRAGDIIEFNILVENTGNLTLTNVVVNDVPTLTTGSPKGNIEIEPSKDRTYIVDGSKATIAVLEPDTEVTIRVTYQVMPGDGTAQGNGLSNAAFVTGTSPDENNPQPTDSSKTEPIPIEPEPDDGKASLEGSITVTKRITTGDGETPEDGVDAMIKVGLYDNASFSGQPIKTNTITISRGTSGNTVFDELDSTAGTVYYVAELDENGKPIIGDGAHLTGYGAPVYSANCKAGINPTTTKDTAASITNPLEAEEIEDDEKTSDTSKSTTSGSNKTTTSTKAAKTGDNTNMMIYWMLLGIAVLAGGVAVIYRKRKER